MDGRVMGYDTKFILIGGGEEEILPNRNMPFVPKIGDRFDMLVPSENLRFGDHICEVTDVVYLLEHCGDLSVRVICAPKERIENRYLP